MYFELNLKNEFTHTNIFAYFFEKITLHTYLKKDYYFKYTQHLKKYFWLSLKKKYTHIF